MTSDFKENLMSKGHVISKINQICEEFGMDVQLHLGDHVTYFSEIDEKTVYNLNGKVLTEILFKVSSQYGMDTKINMDKLMDQLPSRSEVKYLN